VLVHGCESTCVSTLTSGAIAAPSSEVVPSATAITGAEGSTPSVTVSMATASGITDPSACATMSTQSQFQRLRLLRTTTTSHEVHIPSTKVASSSVASSAASVYGSGVGSRSFAERSSPPAGVLVSSSSHDRSVDFLHHAAASSTTQGWLSTYKGRGLGEPRMLAISNSPAFVVASSSAWASYGCSITAAGEGFCLPSPADIWELSVPDP
jgi:hypothetical protein